jgi:MoaA/NifB/PqqE/SkfB family radical SAM enzyme
MVKFCTAYGSIRQQLQRIANNPHYKRHIARDINDSAFREKLIDYNLQRTLGCDHTVCHVPLRSLYFGFGGIVTACCFNRNFVLGKFPDNSIEEMIHGEKRKSLQKHLSCTDFSHGCQFCKNMIASGNFMSVGARLADSFPDKGDLPSEMIFELDNTCNLRCEMCCAKFSSAHNNGIRVTAPYDNEDFIKQLKPFIPHLTETKFLGGEPFLSDIYPKIWETIIELNPKCKIRVQTNGTILNNKVKEILQKGNFQIGLSIDTLNHANYAKIRNGAKIEKTLENLEFFNYICQKNNDHASISVCPMKENRFDIPELVDFCNKNGIYIYFNDVSTEGFSLEELSAQELEELSMYYKKNNRKGHNYISIHNYISFSNLIKKVDYLKGQREQKAYMNETIPCTRDEFVGMISTIISEDESIDIKEAKYLVDYIPENFLIKRSEYLYIKNEMKIDSIKNFISQSKEKQMEHLNKILHI